MRIISLQSMSDNIKVYIIDFEDSFTFNIATELYAFEKKIEVISHSDFFADKFLQQFFGKLKSPVAVILGPGPGSPEEYQNYFEDIKKIKNTPLIYLMGICLGHQILGLMDGLVVKMSKKPMHGGQVKINFEDTNILVQRYNSLALYDPTDGQKEIQVRQWERGVSYQFHPESIGTENRPLFFKELLLFIH